MKLDPTSIKTDERLRELCAGDFEGRRKADVLTEAVRAEQSRLGMDYRYPGAKGESMRMVGMRAKSWLDERFAAWDGEDDREVLVVFHGQLSRSLRALLFGVDPLKAWRLAEGENASVTLIEREFGPETSWQEVFVNRLPRVEL